MTRWKDDPKAYAREYHAQNREQRNAQGRAWYHKNKQHCAELRRAFVFGITQEQYEKMLRDQEGKCAVCRKVLPPSPSKAWGVDHNHETGLVRGILCIKCNGDVIATLDNVELLQEALAYLRRTDPEHDLFKVSES
ncbi:MAG: endonuclease VII domain-containing protein [Acidobacteriales bacterium]|nr:endonuclease VII domain-containing protein [Terriglobales bacterium]